MQWYSVIALTIIISLILFPVVFIWSVTIGGIYAAIKEARTRRAAKREEMTEFTKVLEKR
ncbi:hypothetical protein ACFLTB_05475 [Chloroflexota bacterium]